MEENNLFLKAALTRTGDIDWALACNGNRLAEGLMDDYGDFVDLMDFLGEKNWELGEASAALAGPPIPLGLIGHVEQLRLRFSFRRSESRWKYAQLRMQIYGHPGSWEMRWYIANGADGGEGVEGPEDYSIGEEVTRNWMAKGWALAHTLQESDQSRQLFFKCALTEANCEEVRQRWMVRLVCTQVGCARMGFEEERRWSSPEQVHRRLCSSCLHEMEPIQA